jgi:putative oxidoreductase
VSFETNRPGEIAYAAMRVMVGLLFACHGAQKLFGALGKEAATSPLMVFGGLIEFGGGILIALGLATRFAAFLASGMMAVAYFKAHAPDGFWPIQNKGELAVVYCFVFLAISTLGGGRYSLDHAIRASKPAPGRLSAAALQIARRS